MRIKTLFVSDLDGTLMNRAGEISLWSRETINGLVRQGMLFTYATARSLNSASVVTAGLDLRLPVIVYNGAFLVNQKSGELLSSCFFTKEEAAEIAEVLTRFGVHPLVYAYIEGRESVTWMAGHETPGMQWYLDNRKGDRRLNPVKTVRELFAGDIFYFTCIGSREELNPAACLLEGAEKWNLTFQQELYREEFWLELMPKGATKAAAVLRLKECLGVQRTVCFGDAVNDLPMFAVCDECYAVENAVQALRCAASGLIQGSDADGVAKWLAARWESAVCR